MGSRDRNPEEPSLSVTLREGCFNAAVRVNGEREAQGEIPALRRGVVCFPVKFRKTLKAYPRGRWRGRGVSSKREE
jgi:hypothetical protein